GCNTSYRAAAKLGDFLEVVLVTGGARSLATGRTLTTGPPYRAGKCANFLARLPGPSNCGLLHAPLAGKIAAGLALRVGMKRQLEPGERQETEREESWVLKSWARKLGRETGPAP